MRVKVTRSCDINQRDTCIPRKPTPRYANGTVHGNCGDNVRNCHRELRLMNGIPDCA